MSVYKCTKRRYVPAQRFPTFFCWNRPVEFPYGRPDAGSFAVCPRPRGQGAFAPHDLPDSRAIWIFGHDGEGHATDIAILLGLEGHTPDEVDPNAVNRYVERIHNDQTLHFLQQSTVAFNPAEHLIFHKGKAVYLPFERHPI